MIQKAEHRAVRHQVPGAQKTETAPAQNQEQNSNAQRESRRLAAGDWLRAVAGFSAPFGHDGMPTVWG